MLYFCLLIGSVCYYYFILRKYNSLGFRLFSIFTFITIAFCFWLYEDTKTEKAIETNAKLIDGLLISKTKLNSDLKNSPNNSIAVIINNKDTLSTYEYISEQEWNKWLIGQTLPIYIIDNEHKNIIVQESYNRYLSQKWILYLVTSFFFSLGLLCWYLFRNFKVGVNTETGEEWLEKDGKMIFDERKTASQRIGKRINIISKLIQLLPK